MTPLITGLVTGLVGFLLGSGATAGIRALSGRPAFTGATDALISLGYLVGVIGFLLGVGVYKYWVKEWLGAGKIEFTTTGWKRYFQFCPDHKVIGIQYIVTFASLMILAGGLAMLMRTELMQAGEQIMDSGTYNKVMSLHGIIMIAVAVAVVLGGLGNYLVPLLIGAKDMAFPRLNALSFWVNVPVALALLSSWFLGGWDTGWTAYPPLAIRNASGQVLFLCAVITFGLSSILGGVNFLTTITTMRTKGMTWGRIPIFVWSVFSASIIALLFTQYFAASLFMILLDRVAGTSFFIVSDTQNGEPLLYQHIFWFYSHPAVYVMVIPGFGIMLEVISHFARKPVFIYRWAVGAMLGIVLIGAIVWAHHMFTSGMADYLRGPFMGLTELVSIPTGIIFLSGLGTMWRGKLRLFTPMLFAMAIIFNFVIGGVGGIYNADVTTDINLQDTYWIVGHFHYTILGGEIFGLMAGIYYWFPKITGRMYSERLGKIHFWWMFVTFTALFSVMHTAGIAGMNRRVADYPVALEGINLYLSIMAFLLGASFLLFIYNMINSAVRGPAAGNNPWQTRTLEWQVSSPPPEHNFPKEPEVVGSPYGYGTDDKVHAVVGVGQGAGSESGS